MLELAVLEGYRDSVPWRAVKDLLEVHDISVYVSKANDIKMECPALTILNPSTPVYLLKPQGSPPSNQ